MGILGNGVKLQARNAVEFEVIDPLKGTVVLERKLVAGGQFTVPQGPGAYIIKGKVVR